MTIDDALATIDRMIDLAVDDVARLERRAETAREQDGIGRGGSAMRPNVGRRIEAEVAVDVARGQVRALRAAWTEIARAGGR